MVSSTRRSLERLALAVAVGTPVLLEGPVGCGKTSLVEHLAALVGRTKTPELMKLQLGDQTDSKVDTVYFSGCGYINHLTPGNRYFDFITYWSYSLP